MGSKHLRRQNSDVQPLNEFDVHMLNVVGAKNDRWIQRQGSRYGIAAGGH